MVIREAQAFLEVVGGGAGMGAEGEVLPFAGIGGVDIVQCDEKMVLRKQDKKRRIRKNHNQASERL